MAAYTIDPKVGKEVLFVGGAGRLRRGDTCGLGGQREDERFVEKMDVVVQVEWNQPRTNDVVVEDKGSLERDVARSNEWVRFQDRDKSRSPR